MNLDSNQIPPELLSRPQWVCWAYLERGGKRTKVPIDATTCSGPLLLLRAAADRPNTWATFERALAATASNPKIVGVGFVFASGGGMVGVDLDHCVDSAGNIAPWAAPIVASLDTYAEISPSGTGIKLWARGALPTDKTGGRKFSLDGQRLHNGCAIEAYSRNRFFCFTGQRLPTAPLEVRDCSQAVTTLWDRINVGSKKEPSLNGSKHSPASVHLGDNELLEKIRASKNGDRFKRLWSGDFSGYPSHSEADQALANALAFWTGGDADRIDALFRQSGLMREKWEARDDYRADTIAKAIGGCRGEFFTSSKGQHKRAAAPDLELESTEPEDVDDILENVSGVVNAVEIGGGDKPEVVSLTMEQVLGQINRCCNGWPRRVGSALFVPSAENITWLTKPAAVFGYIAAKTGVVDWRRGSTMVTKEETVSELQRTAQAYEAVEALPHVPPLPGHYYVGPTMEPGNGEALNGLLERFTPETDIDLDLIRAMFATLVWGGPAGSRPAFSITSDAGRGAGKTRLASMAGRLAGGIIDFSSQEDVGQIKQRLLTTDGIGARLALLDNVKSLRFSWAELEALITAEIISGKRMYVGEAQRPNTLIWVVTLNGASLSTDMAQRSVIIKLAKPERSGTWEETTIRYIADYRSAIIADLVGFFTNPAEQLTVFSRWAAWERDVLARLPEPAEAQKVVRERQGVADVEGEEAEIIADHFRTKVNELGYIARIALVHIPSKVAADWLNVATNERHSVTAATRKLVQLHQEDRMLRIRPNACRVHGRGFLWSGEEVEAGQSVAYDVEAKITQLAKPRWS